jgi:hypothetical protein
LSSAILYLAIVVIWACVLVPRWLRRSHDHAMASQDLSGQEEAGQAGLAETEAAAGREAGTGGFGTLREQRGGAYLDPVAWEDPGTGDDGGAWQDAGAPAAAQGHAEATYSVTYSEEISYAEAAGPGVPAAPAAGDPPARGSRSARAHVAHQDETAHHGLAAGGGHPQVLAYQQVPAHPQVTAHPPGPSPRVLQARRRTLTMLITVTAAAIGSAFVGLTPWWTSVAPFLMLGGYLMLLREAAHADAERVHRWAEARARAIRAARAAKLARQRSSYAQVAAPAQPTAEIISIPAMAAPTVDQPYDQYADAEIRAVGD